MAFKYGFNERAYGFCADRYCEDGEYETDLIEGRCGTCHDAYWAEQEFAQANSFDMYDDDFGQVNFGDYYR